MNKQQFEIVKTMQKMGIKPNDFAKACKTKPSLMMKAFASNNYEEFNKPLSKEDVMENFGDLFGFNL